MSELYSFMDGADATLARKVLGEGADDDGAAADGAAGAGERGCRAASCGRGWGCELRPATPGTSCVWRTAHARLPAPAPDAPAAGGERDEGAHRRALYDAMSCMRDVRKRSERTDALFEPLRETVAALQGAGVALPDGVLRQVRVRAELGTAGDQDRQACTRRASRPPAVPRFLPPPHPPPKIENAEARWKGLKKKILNRREALAALQQAEAVDVRRKSDAFSERVDEYRKCAAGPGAAGGRGPAFRFGIFRS